MSVSRATYIRVWIKAVYSLYQEEEEEENITKSGSSDATTWKEEEGFRDMMRLPRRQRNRRHVPQVTLGSQGIATNEQTWE